MLGDLVRELGLPAPATESQASGNSSGTNIESPYAGARVTKLNNHWQPKHFSGDEAIRQSWPLLTARVRDRVRNDSVLSKAKSTLCRLVIGTGIFTYSDISETDDENEDLAKFEIESDIWFKRWAEKEADAEGEHTLWDMQRVAFENEIESGNSLWLQVMDSAPGRTVPLCYQLLEFEQIDTTRDRDAGFLRNGTEYNRISNGIEYDSRNRKVGYWIFDAHPYDASTGWTNESTFIPASRVLHQYLWSRPSGRVGISWFSAPLQSNHDLDRFVANDLTTRGLMALMGVAVHSDDNNYETGLDAEDAETGLPRFKLGYPAIGELKTNDRVEVIESKRGAADSTALINLLLNLQAMGMRISVNRLLGDPTRANLASIKASHQDDDAMVAPVIGSIANKVVTPIREAHTRFGFARGLFRTFGAQDYAARPWAFNTFSSIGANRSDLDVEDGEASIDRLRSGLSTYQDECARRGHHWRRNLRRMRVVNEAARDAGVILDWTKGNGGQLAGSSSDAKALQEAADATNASNQ